jgi:hypothetical protein
MLLGTFFHEPDLVHELYQVPRFPRGKLFLGRDYLYDRNII